MFKRIDHVEIVPRDFEKAIEFYTGVFGFKLKMRKKVQTPGIDEIAMLGLNDTTLEIVGAKIPGSLPGTPHVGYRMMAIEVDDMDKALAYLKSKGVAIHQLPASPVPPRRAEVKDPDGIIIELRQW